MPRMARTRHDRADEDVLQEHIDRLRATDSVLAWVSGEVQRARAARDEAIREAVAAGLSLRQIGGALGLSAEGVRSTLPAGAAKYDRIGVTYASTRQADPRVQAAIWAALGDARSVVNIGAGAGSYEPPQTLLAVEPSLVMIAQRPFGLAPVAVTTADRIPLPDGAVDAAICSLTIHHWDDLDAGFAEIRRVARRVVIFTWDQEVTPDFWLVKDYFPGVIAYDDERAVPLARLQDAFPGARVTTVPVPHDCTDGFLGAFWRRPEAYLDPLVRAGASGFSMIEDAEMGEGLERLLSDLRSGEWRRKYGHLLEQDALDLGYRLVTADW